MLTNLKKGAYLLKIIDLCLPVNHQIQNTNQNKLDIKVPTFLKNKNKPVSSITPNRKLILMHKFNKIRIYSMI